MIEDYKDFQIKINKVPDAQFDFDGFGWAYKIFRGTELYFRVVTKATFGQNDNNNVQSLYKWGITKITSMIDAGIFEKGKIYCYKWITASYPPKEVKCEGFLWDGEQ